MIIYGYIFVINDNTGMKLVNVLCPIKCANPDVALLSVVWCQYISPSQAVYMPSSFQGILGFKLSFWRRGWGAGGC